MGVQEGKGLEFYSIPTDSLLLKSNQKLYIETLLGRITSLVSVCATVVCKSLFGSCHSGATVRKDVNGTEVLLPLWQAGSEALCI